MAGPGMHTVERWMEPEQVREMLLDLPHHPNLGRVRQVLIRLNSGDYVALNPTVPMASGSTSPGAKPTTTVTALHQRHVRNVLSSAPVTAYTDDLEPGQAPPPAAPEPIGPSVTPSAGWLDGLTYRPREKTSPGGIILPGDA